ncbi:MAG: tetratricopeptide repeat protein [Bacteroidia bacterium]|nr:tetratricopeptide repeat protein [Bacteroidia bacterium]
MTPLWSQSRRDLDSLNALVQKTKISDTLRLQAYLELSKQYLNISEYQALEYAKKAFAIAQKLKDTRRQVLSLYYQASALYYQKSYDLAFKLLEEAENLMPSSRRDTPITVQILSLKASLIEDAARNPIQARENYELALQLARETKREPLIIMTLTNLSEFYIRINLYGLAEDIIQEAVSRAEKLGAAEYLRNTLKVLFMLRLEQGRIEEALSIQRRIIDIARKAGIQEWLREAYGFAIAKAIQARLPVDDSLLNKARQEIQDSLELARLLNWVAAEGYFQVSRYAPAKDLYQTALSIAQRKQDSLLIMRVLINLANLYNKQSLHPQAMELLLKARQICEERNDSTRLPMVLNAIGEIHFEQGEWQKSLELFSEAAYYANLVQEDINFPYKVATNLANAHGKLGNPEAARNLYYESALLAQENEDWASAAKALLNRARFELEQGQQDSALKFVLEARRYTQKSRDPLVIAYVNLLWGELLERKGDWNGAIRAYEEAREITEPLEMHDVLAAIYERLIFLYGKQKRYDLAYRLVGHLLASLQKINEQQSKSEITRMEMEYLHQKEKKIQEQQLEEEKLRAEKAKQVSIIITIGAIIVVISIAAVAFVLYRANRRERIINAQLAERNQLIEEQKNLLMEQKDALERAKKDIEESIQYARRIQMAILPDLTPFHERFSEGFVLYLPRDVVSGDFYYFYPLSPTLSLVAVADCTGHGVPGAFMSMIGTTLLNRLAQEEGPKDPAFLLQRLDEELRHTLHHHSMSQQQIKDGMDIALCLIDQQTHMLHFAGARRPLFIFTPEGEFVELKGSRRSIGGDMIQKDIPFETTAFSLKPNLSFYLFSDGIVDQFGWEEVPGQPPRRTKLMSRRLKELLASIRFQSAPQQRDHIGRFIEDWRKDIPQLDDICIIGVRYSG